MSNEITVILGPNPKLIVGVLGSYRFEFYRLVDVFEGILIREISTEENSNTILVEFSGSSDYVKGLVYKTTGIKIKFPSYTDQELLKSYLYILKQIDTNLKTFELVKTLYNGALFQKEIRSRKLDQQTTNTNLDDLIIAYGTQLNNFLNDFRTYYLEEIDADEDDCE